MKVKIPKVARIGAFDYSVKLVPNLADDFKLLGQSITDKQEIRIEPNTTEGTKLVTFWHEVVHGISDVYGCSLDEENTNRIAQGISAILQKNFNIEFDWSEVEE